jgi:phage tail-like protein
MTALLSNIPKVYVWHDTDKSLQYLFEGLDSVWTDGLNSITDFPSHTKMAASTKLVQDWLTEVGNPFWLKPTTELTQQRLVNTIIEFYLSRGTLTGLKNTVDFFFGVIPELELDYEETWKLGFSALGSETRILKYTASQVKVKVPLALTTDQSRLLSTIVEFFKPMHMGWSLESL